MFDIGGAEFFFLLLLGLLIFGPKKLPEIGKQIGGFVAHLRRSMREFQTTLEKEASLAEVKEAAQNVRQAAQDATGMVRRQLDAAGEAVRRDTALDLESDPSPTEPGESLTVEGATDAPPTSPRPPNGDGTA